MSLVAFLLHLLDSGAHCSVFRLGSRIVQWNAQTQQSDPFSAADLQQQTALTCAVVGAGGLQRPLSFVAGTLAAGLVDAAADLKDQAGKLPMRLDPRAPDVQTLTD